MTDKRSRVKDQATLSSVAKVTNNPDLMGHIASFVKPYNYATMAKVGRDWKTAVDPQLMDVKKKHKTNLEKELRAKIKTFNKNRNIIKNVSLSNDVGGAWHRRFLPGYVTIRENQGIMKICNVTETNLVEFMEYDNFEQKYRDVHNTTRYWHRNINLLKESREIIDLLKKYNKVLRGGSKQKRRKSGRKNKIKTLKNIIKRKSNRRSKKISKRSKQFTKRR